jgi:hypothetical protein
MITGWLLKVVMPIAGGGAVWMMGTAAKPQNQRPPVTSEAFTVAPSVVYWPIVVPPLPWNAPLTANIFVPLIDMKFTPPLIPTSEGDNTAPEGEYFPIVPFPD